MKWIPVSERLPEIIGYYLTHDKNYSLSTAVRLWNPDEFLVNCGFDTKHGYVISHWMPLPDPPKEDK